MSRSTLRGSAITAEIRKAQAAAAAAPVDPKAAKKNAKDKAAAAAAPKGAGEIRIIGGLWKRTRLPVAQRPGLRPTPDRVRETLFNWLGQDLAGWRCLDAFAGTGALGLEAASRGAASVLLDPPFDGPFFEPALQAAAQAVAAGGFIYLEAPRAWADEELAKHGLVLYRHLKAGAVHAHLLQRG